MATGTRAYEILDLRHFASADLRPLLESETAVWAREMHWDYSPSAEMILRYIDAKILPGYAIVEHDRIAGYAFFVYEGSKGVIGDVFADSRSRNGAAPSEDRPEERLLTHVIETLQQSPGIHRIEAQLLAHDSGAMVRPFARAGFHRFPRVFMTLPLSRPLPHPALPPGHELRRWREDDFHAAAALITSAYRSHVDSEINDQYCSVSGSLRFLNNVVRFPGCGTFDPGASFVITQPASNSMVALLLCSRVKHDVAHITQVCTLPEHRGHGLARCLIFACAEELRRRAFSTLSLTVTEANRGAVELYRRLGFEEQRKFDAFVWEG